MTARQSTLEQGVVSDQKIFGSAFDDAPIGMAMVSLEGQFINVNRATVRILGYSKKKLLSIDFQSITHPDDLEADASLMKKLIAGSRRYHQIEKRFFHGQGHTVCVNLSVSLLRDSDDNPLFFIAHIQDISEQKRINASLREATALAESANEAKSNFLAMMSHEIRTPMNAMLGMAELLEETHLDQTQQDFVEIIRTSGNTLLTIINDILDFSKIESNKLDLEMDRLDLYDCIENVLSLFSSQAQKKGLSLVSLIEPDNIPDAFIGDSVRLQQVLANLVSNSIKFTQEGEVSIHAKVKGACPSATLENKLENQIENKLENYYEIQFSVEDTGIGIAPDKLISLFEPFSQADASTTRQYGGTGLGLAISQQLVEMMGGKIRVESQIGEGSIFHFSIRLEADTTCDTYKDATESRIDLSQKRLLVVDSVRLSRKYLELQSKSWNIDVTVTDSARAALAKLSNESAFDAIVVSEPLADIEIFQLVTCIRNFVDYRSVPLILLRERGRDTEQHSYYLRSNTEVLQKPVRRSQFYNTLVHFLCEVNQSEVANASNENRHNANNSLEPSSTNLESEIGPLRILLTEDIALNQKVAVQMLASCGYGTDIANNGQEAIQLLKENPYDLVLMDVQMPGMDGLEAARRIRADKAIRQPYIVAVTAHAMQGDRENCLLAGMNSYISKPICKAELMAVLQSCPQLAGSSASELAAFQTVVTQNRSEPAGKLSVASPLGRTRAGLPKAELPKVELPKLYVADDTPPVLNVEVLEGVSGDRSFLMTLCKSFLDEAPARIVAVEEAVEKADASLVRETAHALKSLSACIGAMNLFQICKVMELVGKGDRLPLAMPLLKHIDFEYKKVQLAVRDYQDVLIQEV